MQDHNLLPEHPEGAGVPRRTIVQGAAWTIPVVAVAMASPLAAASGALTGRLVVPGGEGCVESGAIIGEPGATVTVEDESGPVAGATVTFTFSSDDGGTIVINGETYPGSTVPVTATTDAAGQALLTGVTAGDGGTVTVVADISTSDGRTTQTNAASYEICPECVTYDPHGIYGSSGQAIFEYVGSGNPDTFTVPQTGPHYDWAGSLGFGLDKAGPETCATESYAFYGVTWDTGGGNQAHLYKAVPDLSTDGATSIVTDLGTFDSLPTGGYQAAWGGLAVDTAGDVWAVSNTAYMSAAEIAHIDPVTLESAKSAPGTVGVGPNAAKVQPNGLMGPDITFTPDGAMWGLIWDDVSGEYWLARYHWTAGAPLGVEPVTRVADGGTIGGSAWEMRYLVGLAWKGTGSSYDTGTFYVGYGGGELGDVHTLDPVSGASALVAQKTLPDGTGSTYRLEDLASAPVVSDTSAI